MTMMSQSPVQHRPVVQQSSALKNPKDHTRRRGWKEMIAFAVEETSIHGPRHVWYNRSNLLGLFWIAFILTSSVLLVMVSGRYFYDFVQRSEMTQTGIRWSQKMPLPSLAICNKDFFSKKKLDDLKIDPETYNVMMLMTGSPFTMMDDLLSKDRVRDIIQRASVKIDGVMRAYNFTFPELVANVSYRCEELVEACYFLMKYLTGEECCKLMVPIPTMTGLCYTYHTQKGHEQTFVGDFMGMTLYISVPDDKIVLLDGVIRRSSRMKRGIQVTPMSRAAHPSLVVLGMGILVSPSTTTSLEMHAVEKDREDEKVDYIDYKIKPCMPIEQLNYTLNKTTFVKTKTNCFHSSVDRCASEICNCSLYGLDSVYNKEWCKPMESLECLRMLSNFIRGIPDQQKRTKWMKECVSLHETTCSSICRETTYKYSTSYGMNTDVLPEVDLIVVKNSRSLGIVNLYYGSFDADYVKFTREGLPEFLGKFGGQVGLLLGCSVISMAEVIVFGVLICIACCRSFVEGVVLRPRGKVNKVVGYNPHLT
ncbi:acid-sensing ion channel 5-like [Macrobrachium rosenbergii]|uniref:acid-sensing ion channel 5-like n=1 Tax=Macrobrachium rosenbergii TaxID=79674 RepID=UPI0034D6DCF8